jgi:flavin reductase (DIM6/NTAB) family NADH-FMN oxidoreductase RutF
MDDFAELMTALDQTMIVVSAAAGGEQDACLVGFHGQASINPPRYVVMLSDKNRTTRLAADATHLGVHAVGADQIALASIMGELTGDEVDKLAMVRWHPVAEGTPILDDAPGWLVGRIIERVRLGDHIAHVLDVVDASAPPEGFVPLKYKAVAHFEAGHSA